MDWSTILSGAGLTGWIALGIQSARLLLRSNCIRTKCDTDVDGNLRLTLQLNKSQRQIVDSDPEIAERIKHIEELMSAKALPVKQASVSDIQTSPGV